MPDRPAADDLSARHRAAYDAMAARFAAVNAAMPKAVAASAEAFLAALAPAPAPVLDLGCGAGRDLAWFEVRGVRMVGADLSAGMLAQARAQVGAPLVQMDMRALPFRAGAFRGVWCNAALLHLPKAELPLALARIRHLLATDGLLYAGVQVGEGERWEAQRYDPSVFRFFARYAPSEFADQIRRAGFDILQVSENQGIPSRRWVNVLARRTAS